MDTSESAHAMPSSPSPPPSRRVLDLLAYLARHQPKVARQLAVLRLAADDGRWSMSQVRRLPCWPSFPYL